MTTPIGPPSWSCPCNRRSWAASGCSANGPSSRRSSTQGQPWLSSDKLKAVRLLGKQPFDAIDERDVAMVFLASFVLKPDKDAWYWEIATELTDKDIKRFRNSAAVRELDSLKPRMPPKAREDAPGDHRAGHGALDDEGRSPSRAARVMADLAPRHPGF